MRAHDGVDDGEEVARNENVGERAKERAERVIVARRVSELLRANLVRSSSDWNRADRGEIRLGVPYGAVGVIAGVGGRYDLRYRLRDPNESFDFICSMMWLSSSESQISA
jgi:hypothetical protein